MLAGGTPRVAMGQWGARVVPECHHPSARRADWHELHTTEHHAARAIQLSAAKLASAPFAVASATSAGHSGAAATLAAQSIQPSHAPALQPYAPPLAPPPTAPAAQAQAHQAAPPLSVRNDCKLPHLSGAGSMVRS